MTLFFLNINGCPPRMNGLVFITTGFVLNMTEFLIYMTVWSDPWMPKLYLLPTFDQDIDVNFFFLILKGPNEKTSGKLRF